MQLELGQYFSFSTTVNLGIHKRLVSPLLNLGKVTKLVLRSIQLGHPAKVMAQQEEQSDIGIFVQL